MGNLATVFVTLIPALLVVWLSVVIEKVAVDESHICCHGTGLRKEADTF